MKKLKLLTLMLVAGFMLSACSTTSHMVTNNPIGSKVGVAKAKSFSTNMDFSLEKAARNGNIQKITTVDIHALQILIFVRYKTTVTGE